MVVVTTFGDIEPEDSWDTDDSTLRLTTLLFRMVALLDAGPDHPVRRIDPLDEVELRLLAYLKQRSVTGRNLIRVVHIAYGLGFLRSRGG